MHNNVNDISEKKMKKVNGKDPINALNTREISEIPHRKEKGEKYSKGEKKRQY